MICQNYSNHFGCGLWSPLAIRKDGYDFALSLEAGDSVQQENQEVLDLIGLPGSGADYAQRLHWHGIEPDPNMDYFNDHIDLLEMMSELIPEGIFFDPQGGEQIEV